MKKPKTRRVPEEAKIIGKNLRAIRRHAGLSQTQVSAILGVTFQQVQKYEQGGNRFPIEKLYILKNHLDLPYHIFFMGLEPKPGPKPGEEGARPWPHELCARLEKTRGALLRDKIERVVSIMLE